MIPRRMKHHKLYTMMTIVIEGGIVTDILTDNKGLHGITVNVIDFDNPSFDKVVIQHDMELLKAVTNDIEKKIEVTDDGI